MLSAEDFLDWGWRYPFFVAFAINVVALFARLRIGGDAAIHGAVREAGSCSPRPIGDTVRCEGRHIILGAFAPLASFALFHMVTVFPLSWVFLFTDQSPARFLIIEMIGAAVGIVAIVASGLLADRVGRRTCSARTAVAIAVFSGFAPQLLDARRRAAKRSSWSLGFALLGLSFGQSSGARRIELLEEVPLYRIGPDQRSGLAVRRRALRRWWRSSSRANSV